MQLKILLWTTMALLLSIQQGGLGYAIYRGGPLDFKHKMVLEAGFQKLKQQELVNSLKPQTDIKEQMAQIIRALITTIDCSGSGFEHEPVDDELQFVRSGKFFPWGG